MFLHQAARSSWELMRVRARLESLRVQDVMTRAPLIADLVAPLAEAGAALRGDQVVRPHDSAWSAFLKLGRTRDAHVPVVEGQALVGVVTERDLQGALAAAGGAEAADAARRAA
jgi:CBS domain-containing protein